MPETITLELPDEAVQRYRHGATVAHKKLEEFLVERLVEAPLPLADDLPPPLDEVLRALETLNDDALWEVAQSQLSLDQQDLYEALLQKNSEGNIIAAEEEILHALGQQARRLTLKKAHAYMLLKWRGHTIPSPEELCSSE